MAKSPARAFFLVLRKLAQAVGLVKRFDILAGRLLVHLPVRRRKEPDGLGNGQSLEIVQTMTPEYWIGTSLKMHAALKYLSKHEEFDFLVRTNSSSYLDVPLIVQHLQKIPARGVYVGSDQGERHAQGTLIILSSDVVALMAKDGHWGYAMVDDEAIGDSASRAEIACRFLLQRTVGRADDLPEDSLDEQAFIYRMKTRADRGLDGANMYSLHDHLLRRRNTSGVHVESQGSGQVDHVI